MQGPPDLPLPKREFAMDMETSYVVAEDEFGSECFCRCRLLMILISAGDEFDEADIAVTNDGHPDVIALSNGVQSDHFPARGNAPIRREPQGTGKGPPVPRFSTGPQTPSAAPSKAQAPAVKSEHPKPGPPAQRLPQPPNPQQYMNAPPSRPQGVQAPQPPIAQTKPAETSAFGRHNQLASTNVPNGTLPTLDSSSATEHNPPVGFFTARAAETLQKGSGLPPNVPAFNPHLESPSIRKTAGVDHTKTKPVKTESIGLPTTAVAPKTNFVNPQTDKTRKVGMPVSAVSPTQNKNSYKPPQMKRSADGVGVQ